MVLRDLGYKPYEGKRHPPSRNTWVLLRYGLRRAWASWLVKLALLFAIGPAIIKLASWWIFGWLSKQNPGQIEVPEPADYVRDLCGWQLWLFASAIALGAGSAAIAEDVARRALPFYFSKPVTPTQYLLGRAGAVATLTFLVTFIPALALVGVLAGLAPEGELMERVLLVLPTTLYALCCAAVVAICSVGISSLSESRALTASGFILVWLLPQALAAIVDMTAQWPWLYLASLPELLSVLGDGIFRRPAADAALRWYHVLPVLIVACTASWWAALRRLSRTDVVA